MVTTTQTNGNSSLEIAQSSQELVSKDRSNRKRTCLVLGLIALGAVIVLVAAIVITSGGTNHATNANSLKSNAPAITLEDFLEGRLIPHSFNATWISENELLYRDSNENIVLRNVATRTSRILLVSERIPLLTFDYQLSADQKYMMLAHGYQKLYSRYSFLAQYTIIDLVTFERIPLTANNNKERHLRLALFGTSGNSVVYIYGNNIYYRPAARFPEIQLTTDGESGKIYNGIPDWVYEEEVLSSNKALWFSKTGKKLAYLAVNDSNVGIMNIPYYGYTNTENLEFQYSKTIPLRYPKAGTPNPEVNLVTVDLDSIANFRLIPTLQAIPPPASLGREPILGAATWTDDETVCAIWLNRLQNQAEIVCCDAVTTTCDMITRIEEKNGWLEMFTEPLFNKDGTKMLLIMSQDQGEGIGGYRHVTLIERKQNAKPIALSKGKFVVTEILSWDESKDLVYFLGTSEKDPAVQHLYSVSSNPTASKEAKCITCSVKNKRGKECLYNGVIFSPNSSYYTLNCAGPSVPEVSIYNNNHKKLMTWEINEELLELVEDKQIPQIKRFEVDVSGGFKAQVLLQLPPNLDTSGDIKYPMIVDVYGGPNSYDVLEKFSLNWFSYLASNKSIIVASIDGRGSGLKGDKMLFAGYKNLGTVEIFDQLNVTRHLQQELPYIDSKRTAIWGWSYGGYAAGLALARDTQNVFKCGISTAPVTDWTLYDSIYTERVMGLPGHNLQAYKEAGLLNKVEKLRNKQYLLVHGTLDDNVHYQQSMLFAKALELNDIQFRQQTYPDEDHGLSSVRKHLYHTFESFLDTCFDPSPDS